MGVHIQSNPDKKGRKFHLNYKACKQLGFPNLDTFQQNFMNWCFQKDNLKVLKNITIENHPDLKPLHNLLPKIIRLCVSYLGSFDDALLGVENSFKNLQKIAKRPRLEDMTNTFRSALLIGAGPSADSAWDSIRYAQQTNKFLILCVDAIYKRALEEGVTPHIVTSAERHGRQWKFFTDVTSSAFVFTPFQVNPKTLDVVRIAHSYGFCQRADYLKDFYPFNRITVHAAAGVSPMSLSLLARLGIQSIGLIGHDLCYGKNNASHANLGSVDKKLQTYMQSIENKRERWQTETYEGKITQTTQWWNTFRNQLSVIAKQNNLETFQTHKSSSIIPFVPYKPLDDYVCEPGHTNGNFLPTHNNPDFRRDQKKLKQHLKTTQSQLKHWQNKLRGNVNVMEFINTKPITYLLRQALEVYLFEILNERFAYDVESHKTKQKFIDKAQEGIEKILEFIKNQN